MIENIDGDIFKIETNAILHCANCMCVMGSGIALTISRLYPEAVLADNETKAGDIKKLGKYSSATGKNSIIIYNLYGQYVPGAGIRQLNYEAFYTATESAHKDILSKNLKTVSVPYNIGCDRAGGSWTVVNAILTDIFEKSPVKLKICKFAVK